MCFQLTHLSYDDCENTCILSYHHHHQIRSMTQLSLFRVRSWNNGMRCMSFYIITTFDHYWYTTSWFLVSFMERSIGLPYAAWYNLDIETYTKIIMYFTVWIIVPWMGYFFKSFIKFSCTEYRYNSCIFHFNSLWPSDAIQQHRSASTCG